MIEIGLMDSGLESERYWSDDCDNHTMISFDGNLTMSDISFIHVPFHLYWLDELNIWPDNGWNTSGIVFKHRFEHWDTVLNCECPTELPNEFFPVLVCYVQC